MNGHRPARTSDLWPGLRGVPTTSQAAWFQTSCLGARRASPRCHARHRGRRRGSEGVDLPHVQFDQDVRQAARAGRRSSLPCSPHQSAAVHTMPHLLAAQSCAQTWQLRAFRRRCLARGCMPRLTVSPVGKWIPRGLRQQVSCMTFHACSAGSRAPVHAANVRALRARRCRHYLV